MIEKQIGSIEADRGSKNFWKEKKKHSFWKEQRHSVETPQSIEIDEQKCMSMWYNVFQKKKF